MKQKGFAISSMLYTVLLLFLVLLMGILGLLGTRKIILDKMKNEVASSLNGVDDIYLHFQYKDIMVANTSLVDHFDFIPTDIVSVVDRNGNTITGASISYDAKPSFDSTKNGVYMITYTGTYQGKQVNGSTTIEVVNPIHYDYGYSGREESFSGMTNGMYQVKLWGAGGGYGLQHGKKLFDPGKGAYTSGNIILSANDILYLHVGGKGEDAIGCTVNGKSVGGKGGYNGGGKGGDDNNPETNVISCSNEPGGGGGGATDVSIVSGSSSNFDRLKARIMVAAGGGGSNFNGPGGNAGGLTSDATETAVGSSQTSGYQFGIGMAGMVSTDGDGGGGGGYYGGSSVASGTRKGASGGSSFISGYTGSNAIQESSTATTLKHSNQPNHYSGYIFSNGVMSSGKESMPTFDLSSTMTGNSEEGFASIIPLIVERGILAKNLVLNSGFESGNLDEWIYSSNQYTLLFDDSKSVSGRYSAKLTNKTVHKDNQQIYQILDTIPGHIYYASAYMNTTVTDVAKTLTRITFSPGDSWDWLIYSPSTSASKGVWMKHSIWYTNPSYTSMKYRLALGGNANGSTIGDYYSVDSAMVLDLTQIYGAGNEPTKEWCDEHIRYFDGVGYVPKYVK